MEEKLDDNVIIPNWIKEMPADELEKSIVELETELFQSKKEN